MEILISESQRFLICVNQQVEYFSADYCRKDSLIYGDFNQRESAFFNLCKSALEYFPADYRRKGSLIYGDFNQRESAFLISVNQRVKILVSCAKTVIDFIIFELFEKSISNLHLLNNKTIWK
ncbi:MULTISPECIES: hypothetical protein [unclassified Arcicella]|uniref:hypothetical protein n=1 Tax=unclassified Arcicella TaxID=2644986 RepID=UPI002857E783|nr:MULTISPECIES: hypothetical protein [unclassified Arcicella]MDR6563273.1 hypothetical protein [Arcicella sp. BE51]MDR6811576.1 hypothetical protein [Arcicella sp. BE140]MDR6823102.1 hypothetical protein [Arcicella sp. BE139]